MAEIYSSLYKGLVHITTPFSSSHPAIDIGNYKVKNAVYSANKLGNGAIQSVATSYKSPATGLTYQNSLVIWIKYDNGMRCGMYHGEVGDRVVSVGDRVYPGMQVYKTGDTGNSKGDHLHYNLQNVSGVNIDPAPWVLNDQNVIAYKMGDQIEIIESQNIRKGNGIDFEITGQTKPGQVYTIEGGPRIADGYTWWDLKDSNWIADTGKFRKYVAPTPPVPPVEVPDIPNCDIYIKQIELLKEEIKVNSEALGRARDIIKVREERVKYLEDTLKTREAELDEVKKVSEVEIKRLKADLGLKNTTLEDTVAELNAFKKSRVHWIYVVADLVYNILNKKKP